MNNMNKLATQISNAQLVLENTLGKDELNHLISKAKSKIDEIKTITGIDDEIAIIKTNIKLAKSPEAKAIWVLCLAQ